MEPVSVTLTEGQSLVFRNLATQEREAQQVLASVAAARNAAALMVVLREFEPAMVEGVQLSVLDGEIAFTPNAPAPLAVVA